MSDDIIIVSCFPNNLQRLHLLCESLIQLKKLNKEIILVSNCPIPIEIQKSVNYFIFDSRNEILYRNEFIKYISGDVHFFWATDGRTQNYLRLNLGAQTNHSYTIYSNLLNALSLAKRLNKKYIYYTEFDNIISNQDLPLFDKLKTDTLLNNKLGYFEQMDNWYIFSAAFFFCDVNFLSNLLPNIQSKTEYLETFKHNFLFEWMFFQILNPYKDKLDIKISKTGADYFSNSKINISNSFDGGSKIIGDIVKDADSNDVFAVCCNFGDKDVIFKYSLLSNGLILKSQKIQLYSNGIFYDELFKDDIENHTDLSIILEDMSRKQEIKININETFCLEKRGYIKFKK